MSKERPPVRFPWRSIAVLLALGAFLVWCAFGTAPPDPSLAERREARLWEAVQARDAQGVAQALTEGAAPQDGLLAQAAANDDLPTMVLLLAHGADVNAHSSELDERGYIWSMPQSPHSQYDEPRLYWSRATPLMEAVQHDNLAAARLLLERGAAVDARNDAGATALMLASGSARPQIVQTLLLHGADVNAKADSDWTPLMSASAAGQSGSARLLVAHGADINAHDTQGDTPLAVALAWKQPDIAAFLRTHGARDPLPPPAVTVRPMFSSPAPFVAYAPPKPPPPPSYAAFAAPLVGTEDGSREGPLWITGSKWLAIRFHPRRLTLTDARTGTQTPLPGLTAFWNQTGHNIPLSALHVSPDGKWLLGPTSTAWTAVSLSGAQSQSWPCLSGAIADPIFWLPDSQRWAELDGMNPLTVRVRRLGHTQAVSFPLIVRPHFEIFGLENNFAFAASGDGWAAEIAPPLAASSHRSRFHRQRMIVTIRRLVPGRTAWTFSTSTLSEAQNTADETITECVRSPQGDRLAWRQARRRHHVVSLYISRPDGRVLHRIFTTPAGLLDTPHGLCWTPDGRHLSFWWGHRAYWIPTPPESPLVASRPFLR